MKIILLSLIALNAFSMIIAMYSDFDFSMKDEECDIVVVRVLDKYEENIDAIAKQHGFLIVGNGKGTEF
jgi:hypothetical protein